MATNQQLEDKLKAFPSLFLLEKPNLKITQVCIDKLLRECSTTGYPLGEEYIRAYNCLSFWYCRLGNQTMAEEYHELAVEKERGLGQEGIVTLANKAWMLYQQCDFAGCEDLCKRLENLSTNEFLVLDARAQQAYCYARMGVSFAQKAVDILRETVKHAEYEHSESTRSSFILWKYGLGLNLRRLAMINIPVASSESERKEKIKEAAAIFFKMSSSTEETYKARAYVELGDLKYYIDKYLKCFPSGVLDVFPKHLQRFQLAEFYQKALETAQNDVFVLERCGRQFRYTREYWKAINCFQRAISVRPTSFSHQFLAMTLRSMLNTAVVKNNRHPAKHRDFSRIEDPWTTKGNKQRWSAKKGSDQAATCKVKTELSLEQSQPQKMQRCSPTVLTWPDDEKAAELMRECFGEDEELEKIMKKGLVKEILRHLDEAVTIGESMNALCEKGIVQRSLGQPKEAMDSFAKVCRHERSGSLDIATSYEQQAWCLLEMNAKADDEQRKNNDRNACHLFMKSIEMTASIVKSHPSFHGSRMGFQELERLLSKKEKYVSRMQKMSMAHEVVGQYQKAIDLYREIIEIDPEKESDPDIGRRMVQDYLELKDFSSAVGVLDVLLQVGKKHVDPVLYLKTHIEGGFDALKEGERELAKKRFKGAFSFEMENTSINTVGGAADEDGVEIADQFDAYICCGNDENDAARCIWKLLNNMCGISATVNVDDVCPGSLEIQGIGKVMERSKHFIIVLDDERETDDGLKVSMLLELYRRRHGSCHVVVVRTSENVEVPVILGRFPALDFSLRLRHDVDYVEPDTSKGNLNWIQELMIKLLNPGNSGE